MAPLHGVGRGFESLIAHINKCGKIPVKEGTHYSKMDNVRVRCRSCGKELVSTSKVQYCGCSNQMMVIGDKISAVDLSQVVMLNSHQPKTKKGVLSQQDIEWQEQRKKRKVRKLDFEVR